MSDSYMNEAINKLEENGGIRFSFLHKYRHEILLFLAVFLLNGILSAFLQSPIFTDEYVTMGEGVYLWGNPDWGNAFASALSYYFGYGYSMLYAWVYNITGDTQALFHAALWLNSFFVALIPVIAYRILRRFLSAEAKKAFLAAMCVGLFPASVVISKYATNDTMLLFLPWIILYICLCLFDKKYSMKKSIVLHCVLGALSCYAYVVHGRGLALLICAFVFILIVYARRKSFLKGLAPIIAFIAVVALIWFADSIIKGNIIDNFLSDNSSSNYNTLDNALSVTLPTALAAENIKSTIQGFLNHSFYVICATFGLASLAVFAFAQTLGRLKKIKEYSREKKNLMFLTAFVLLCSLLIVAMSTIFFAQIYVTGEAARGEYYIYGRYVETVCAMLVFVVLAFLASKHKIRLWAVAAAAVVTAAFLIYGAAQIPYKIMALENNTISYAMSFGVMPFMGADNTTEITAELFIILGVTVGAVSALMLVLTYKKKFAAVVLALLACFTFSFVYSMSVFIYPISAYQAEQVEAGAAYADKNGDLAAAYPHIYIMNKHLSTPRYQLAMPQFDLSLIDVERYGYGEFADIAENSVILGKADDKLEQRFNNMFRMKNVEYEDIYCWVYGEELKQVLETRGYEFYADDENTLSVFNPENHTLYAVEQGAESYDAPERTYSTIVAVKAGEVQCGSEQEFLPGRYIVTYYGDNLDLLEYDVVCSGGSGNGVITDWYKKSDNFAQYAVEFAETADNVEFRAYNYSQMDDIAVVDEIQVECESFYKADAADGAKLTQPVRKFEMTHRSFKETLLTDGDVVRAQTGTQINRGGAVTAEHIEMYEGRSAVVLKGSNMQVCEYRLIGGDGAVIHTEELSRSEEQVIFSVSMDEYDAETKIVCENNTEGAEMILRDIYIRYEGKV